MQVVIRKSILSLFSRIFKSQTPSQDFNMYFLYRFILHGCYCKGTLLDSIVEHISPARAAFSPIKCTSYQCDKSVLNKCIADLLQFLISCENYFKPWSLNISWLPCSQKLSVLCILKMVFNDCLYHVIFHSHRGAIK